MLRRGTQSPSHAHSDAPKQGRRPDATRMACTAAIPHAPGRGDRQAVIGSTYGGIEIPYWL
ncbi:hypothetical protein ABTH20_21535, partial [Acinetobacter baumannii]